MMKKIVATVFQILCLNGVLFSGVLIGGILISCGGSITKEDIQINLQLDPFKQAPLSVLAKIELDDKDEYDVKVVVKGRNVESSETEVGVEEKEVEEAGINISHTFENQKESFEIPVLGLYPDHENQLLFSFYQDGKLQVEVEKIVTTDPLPTNIVVPLEILENNLPEHDQQVYLVANLNIAFDQQGEIRWAYNGDSFLNYGKVRNGNLIVTHETNLRMLYHYEKFSEVSMLGETIKTYDISKYYGHHDIVEMPENSEYSGDFLVMVNEAAPSTAPNVGDDGVNEEDYIILLDRETGKVKKEWDLKKLFDQNNPHKHHIPATPQIHKDDWIHGNANYYDPTDHSIVFSSRHQSAVVKYHFDSGELVWIIADNTGKQWSNERNAYGQTIAEYVLKAVDEEGKEITDPGAVSFWPYGQHDSRRVYGLDDSKERIFLYDNGNARNYFQYGKQGTKYKNFPKFSRAVEYLVNPQAMTVQKIWEYDHNRQFYTIATGSAEVLPNQNRLIGFMWTTKNKKTPRIIELDPNDKILFNALVNHGKQFYYQAEKFDLYLGI